jgi:peptide deformylase
MQHELDHLDGKLYIDYLESFDDLIPVSRLDEEIDGTNREMPALA